MKPVEKEKYRTIRYLFRAPNTCDVAHENVKGEKCVRICPCSVPPIASAFLPIPSVCVRQVVNRLACHMIVPGNEVEAW